MPKPKVRKPYNFLYTDGSYITYDLTKDEYTDITQLLGTDAKFVKVDFGILALSDIRSVVELKEEKKEVKTSPVHADPIVAPEIHEYLQYMRRLEEEGGLN